MFEVIGWLGSILFSMCAVPQVWQCYRQKHADGLSWTFLLMWLTGEVLTAVYVWPTQQYPLLANYFFNGVCLLVILRYRMWPRSYLVITEVNHAEGTVTVSNPERFVRGDRVKLTIGLPPPKNRETLRRK